MSNQPPPQPRPYYIQRNDGQTRETVDQFETQAEARAMLTEYQMSDRTAQFYISRRPCKAWEERT
jgi:hypothetical protein